MRVTRNLNLRVGSIQLLAERLWNLESTHQPRNRICWGYLRASANCSQNVSRKPRHKASRDRALRSGIALIHLTFEPARWRLADAVPQAHHEFKWIIIKYEFAPSARPRQPADYYLQVKAFCDSLQTLNICLRPCSWVLAETEGG